jgi:leucyl aminopeptidase
MLNASFIKKTDGGLPILLPIFLDDLDPKRRKVFRGLSRAQKRAVRTALTRKAIARSGLTPIFSGDAPVYLLALKKKKRVATREAREAGEQVFHSANRFELKTLAIGPGSLDKPRFSAFQEGVLLGAYEFLAYKGNKKGQKKDPETKLENVRFYADGTRKELERLQALAAGVALAKDLVNTPPSVANPEFLTAAALGLAKSFPAITAKVIEAKELIKMNCGGIINVGKGSKVPPRLIILEYKAAKKAEAPLVLVGKGVTFDTGGHSLKPGKFMRWMKQDMAGAATLLGMLRIVAELKVAKNVTVLIPAVENSISRDAYLPDDILRMYNGMTVEIHNTDAEGRLILADALAYANETMAPRAMIDIATLTGACAYAVGNDFAAGLANNDRFYNRLAKAAQAVDEPLWRLPLHRRYAEALKSKTADIVNCSDELKPGTIEGALFLQHFVQEKTPWCHLDIASVAFNEKAGMATGRQVRTLARFVEDF